MNMPMIINVAYTVQEIQALTKLLDIATKAGGLSVANEAAILHAKHLAAAQEATTPVANADEFTMRKQLRDKKTKIGAVVNEDTKDS